MKTFITLLVILPLAVEALRYAAPPRRRVRQRPTRRPFRTLPTRPATDPWPTDPASATDDPWPANRRTTRDPWTANPIRRTRDPWPTDRVRTTRRITRRTTLIPTTTPTPTGRDFCQSLIASGDCRDFYTCFLTTQQACGPNEVPQGLDALIGYCVQSEDVQDDNAFDRRGNRYITEYRRCTQRRLLSVVDSRSCDDIDTKAKKILLTDDLIWDCLYQNHTLCDVIGNGDNSVALGLIFTGTDELSSSIYQLMLKRVGTRCGARAGRQFVEGFGQTFLSNMQNRMSGMMMMGGNGGD